MCVCVFARVCIMIQAGGKVECRAEVVKVGESGAGQGALRGQRCAVFMFLLYLRKMLSIQDYMYHENFVCVLVFVCVCI